jgi:hypothetical protein
VKRKVADPNVHRLVAAEPLAVLAQGLAVVLLQELLQTGENFATLSKVLAQLARNILRQVPRPSLGRVGGDDAGW